MAEFRGVIINEKNEIMYYCSELTAKEMREILENNPNYSISCI